MSSASSSLKMFGGSRKLRDDYVKKATIDDEDSGEEEIYVDRLKKYCRDNNLSKPEFEKKSEGKRYHVTVIVDGKSVLAKSKLGETDSVTEVRNRACQEWIKKHAVKNVKSNEDPFGLELEQNSFQEEPRQVPSSSQEEVYHDGLKKYLKQHNLHPEFKYSFVNDKCQMVLTVGGQSVMVMAKKYDTEKVEQIRKRVSQKWMETHAKEVKSIEDMFGSDLDSSQESVKVIEDAVSNQEKTGRKDLMKQVFDSSLSDSTPVKKRPSSPSSPPSPILSRSSSKPSGGRSLRRGRGTFEFNNSQSSISSSESTSEKCVREMREKELLDEKSQRISKKSSLTSSQSDIDDLLDSKDILSAPLRRETSFPKKKNSIFARLEKKAEEVENEEEKREIFKFSVGSKETNMDKWLSKEDKSIKKSKKDKRDDKVDSLSEKDNTESQSSKGIKRKFSDKKINTVEAESDSNEGGKKKTFSHSRDLTNHKKNCKEKLGNDAGDGYKFSFSSADKSEFLKSKKSSDGSKKGKEKPVKEFDMFASEGNMMTEKEKKRNEAGPSKVTSVMSSSSTSKPPKTNSFKQSSVFDDVEDDPFIVQIQERQRKKEEKNKRERQRRRDRKSSTCLPVKGT